MWTACYCSSLSSGEPFLDPHRKNLQTSTALPRSSSLAWLSLFKLYFFLKLPAAFASHPLPLPLLLPHFLPLPLPRYLRIGPVASSPSPIAMREPPIVSNRSLSARVIPKPHSPLWIAYTCGNLQGIAYWYINGGILLTRKYIGESKYCRIRVHVGSYLSICRCMLYIMIEIIAREYSSAFHTKRYLVQTFQEHSWLIDRSIDRRQRLSYW